MTVKIDLTKYPKRSDLRSFVIVIAHLVVVLAPVYLGALIGPGWLWIGLWIWCGLLLNGLLNLMHESAHYHVFSQRSASDFLGHWILGPLLMADFSGYRWRHWEHHTHLGVDGDTKDTYLINIRRLLLVGLLLRCLGLVEGIRRFRVQTPVSGERRQQPPNHLVWLARTSLVQAVFLASLILFAGPLAGRGWTKALYTATLAYGVIYVYGLASLTVFAATLRSIAEHQLETGEHSDTGRAALRNFTCGPVVWLLFGAYGFAEHATHHSQPGVPYYHLGEVTHQLASDDPAYVPRHGYLRELAKLVRSA
jgi:fatty acid desaturase